MDFQAYTCRQVLVAMFRPIGLCHTHTVLDKGLMAEMSRQAYKTSVRVLENHGPLFESEFASSFEFEFLSTLNLNFKT